jgi:para-nitrobenzyl esterase
LQPRPEAPPSRHGWRRSGLAPRPIVWPGALLLGALVLGATVLAGCSAPPARPERGPGDALTLRTLDAGPVLGYANPFGGHTWLGIPYAAPPVGELRWRAPRPVTAWNGVRNALLPGEPCIQFGSPLGGVGPAGSRQGSEDCLYLNVYAPAIPPEALAGMRLPVMVWIHGGGNTVGHAAFYEGGVLASRENVVVVSINYRLGPFGWFVPPDGSTEEPTERSGNFGNLDTLEALRWVQRNAAAFGGDPGNVTVFGESAGATNALALLVAPAAVGLFHKVILQSNAYGLSPLPAADSLTGSSSVLRRLLVSTGKAADARAADAVARGMSPAEAAAFLRGLDPWTVYGGFRRDDGDFQTFPTVFGDGAVLRAGELPDLLADPALHHDVPVIVGSNRDENKIFMAFDPRHVRTVGGIPVGLRDPEGYDRLAKYRALLWKADAVDDLASLLARHGEPAYAYRWDWDEQGKAYGVVDLSRIIGAAHGLEIPFVFGHFDLGPQSGLIFGPANEGPRLDLSRRMMGYWAAFARSGRPGNGGRDDSPDWLPWRDDAGAARLMVFDTVAGGGTRMVDERVSRDTILARLDSEPLASTERCELFRATFRVRRDPWADEAWQRLAGGRCEGPRVSAPQPVPVASSE